MLQHCAQPRGGSRRILHRARSRLRPPTRPAPSAQRRIVHADVRAAARASRGGLRTDLESIADSQRLSLERRRIQWYPGHIAAAERQLQNQLSRVDIVFEVRDARILASTAHPSLEKWAGKKPRFTIVNRTDMVSSADLAAWRTCFAKQYTPTFYTNAQSGQGVQKVIQASKDASTRINAGRIRRGLKPRPVRACVVGYPNIGKSALINRLLNRRVVESAARPGVTTALRWVRMSEDLDLLDAPGIIPSAMDDQAAATRLAVCNDIGTAAYLDSVVAAAFIEIIPTLPRGDAIMDKLRRRYHLPRGVRSGEDAVWALADRLFEGDPESAGQRVLNDYRNLRLGLFALELPTLEQ